MLVPEATVDKNHFPAGWKYEIGAAWEVAPMQSETVTKSV